MQDDFIKRFVETFKSDALPAAARNITQALKAVSDGQKLYVSTARGWRDRDSLLTRCYAIDAFEDKPWDVYAAPRDMKFVTIGDATSGVRGREYKNILIDEDHWFYQFVNGEGIRIANLDPKPIEIELSLSDLVGEE